MKSSNSKGSEPEVYSNLQIAKFCIMGCAFLFIALFANAGVFAADYPAPVRDEVTRIKLFLSNNCSEPVRVKIDEAKFPTHVWKEKVLPLLLSSHARPCPLALGSWSLDLASERNAEHEQWYEAQEAKRNAICAQFRECIDKTAAVCMKRMLEDQKKDWYHFIFGHDSKEHMEQSCRWASEKACGQRPIICVSSWGPLGRGPDYDVSFIIYTPVDPTRE